VNSDYRQRPTFSNASFLLFHLDTLCRDSTVNGVSKGTFVKLVLGLFCFREVQTSYVNPIGPPVIGQVSWIGTMQNESISRGIKRKRKEPHKAVSLLNFAITIP
jgi:hypothetical protein